MSVEHRLSSAIIRAVHSAINAGLLPSIDDLPTPELTPPKSAEHGDLSTNIAFQLAARMKQKPKTVADAILAHLPTEGDLMISAEVAGAGYINFRIDPNFFFHALSVISKEGERYGCNTLGAGKKVQVEFVSANPTGPLHIGHGRGAVYGDVLSNLLSASGYAVTREYYLNDTGVQMRTLGLSVWLRTRELRGEAIEFPNTCYQGDYVRDIAQDILAKHASWLVGGEEQVIERCGQYAGKLILENIKRDLDMLGVHHEKFFCEHELHERHLITETLEELSQNQQTYEQDGALWFRSTAFGDDKDRVLRKSDGQLTYFAADIAYHREKYRQGYDTVIDIWGADHGGYVARMMAAVQALGQPPQAFSAVLIQLVNLIRDGKMVSMSTRSAQYDELSEVLRSVGRDVCRYFFLMRSHNAQLDFDLDMACKQSPENPVYYIQYAHARICSIFRKAEEQGIHGDQSAVNASTLGLAEELQIAKLLLQFPHIISECAKTLEPHRLAFFLLELARAFQGYYSAGRADERYRVLGDNPAIAGAKLALLKNVQVVLQNGLRILGISAPTTMSRDEESNA